MAAHPIGPMSELSHGNGIEAPDPKGTSIVFEAA